jgi:hypothetical protein
MDIEQAKNILESYIKGGSFKNALYHAVSKADLNNLSLLYLAYPSLVTAYCVNAGIEHCPLAGKILF